MNMATDLSKSSLTVIPEFYYEVKEKYHEKVIVLVHRGRMIVAYEDDAVAVREIFNVNEITVYSLFCVAFPESRLYDYLPRMIRRGWRVAVAEGITPP